MSANFRKRIADLHRSIEEFFAAEPGGAAVVMMRVDADGTTLWRMVSEGAKPIFLETLQRLVDEEQRRAPHGDGGTVQ
jgi:hypothetical protein